MTLELSLRTKRFSMQAMREAVERVTSAVVVSRNVEPEVADHVQDECEEVKGPLGKTIVPGTDYDYGPT